MRPMMSGDMPSPESVISTAMTGGDDDRREALTFSNPP
jgi:hypothetical protein